MSHVYTDSLVGSTQYYGMRCLYCVLFPPQPNGAEEIYAMDQLSPFEQEKMKEVNNGILSIMFY